MGFEKIHNTVAGERIAAGILGIGLGILFGWRILEYFSPDWFGLILCAVGGILL
jgi:hypothetical protein